MIAVFANTYYSVPPETTGGVAPEVPEHVDFVAEEAGVSASMRDGGGIHRFKLGRSTANLEMGTFFDRVKIYHIVID